MTDLALIERITRSLAFMLRHQPETFDLELDAYGFADLDDVVHALNERLGEPVEEEDVREAVRSGDRPRYQIEGERIRALYGHSIPVEPGPSSKPPEFLYVAIPASELDRARRFGLRGGRRRFLHLAMSQEDAAESGRRASRSYAILVIHALDAWEEGVSFYDRSALWLAEEVPTHLIEVAGTFDDGSEPMRRHEGQYERPAGGRDGGHERGEGHGGGHGHGSGHGHGGHGYGGQGDGRGRRRRRGGRGRDRDRQGGERFDNGRSREVEAPRAAVPEREPRAAFEPAREEREPRDFRPRDEAPRGREAQGSRFEHGGEHREPRREERQGERREGRRDDRREERPAREESRTERGGRADSFERPPAEPRQREREEAPRRERRDSFAPSGFGAGLDSSAPAREREAAPPPRPAPAPAPRREEPSRDEPGFGAGL